MAQEIERKFLVKDDPAWREVEAVRFRQGYLCNKRQGVVRVRIAGTEAYLTIKGETRGAVREEYEYPIPLEDAESMLETLCRKPLIEKTRRRIDHGGMIWEVDEFFGENQGLIVAEVELESETQPLEMPEWIGAEVTGDPDYYNASLVIQPYSQWSKGNKRRASVT